MQKVVAVVTALRRSGCPRSGKMSRENNCSRSGFENLSVIFEIKQKVGENSNIKSHGKRRGISK